MDHILYQIFKITLKETQTFKAYCRESYKYCIIMAGSNTKISKIHGLLNKILFCFCPSPYLQRLVLSVAFLNGSFFISWTQYSANVKRHKWSFVSCIVSFSGLKMVFSKLNQLDVIACIKNCVHNSFDLSYFMSSVIEHLYKSFSLIDKFFCTNLALMKKFLEILQTYSEAATGGVP